MDEFSTNLTRRTLFAAGGLGAIALAGMADVVSAAPASSTGKANIKVVTDFCNSWSDADKLVTFLSDDTAVRMSEGKPPVIGPAAVVAAFKPFTGPGKSVSVKILTSAANGPVVVNTRIDTIKDAGKPDRPFKVVGVFILKDGKIKEWSDYLDA